MPKVDHTDCNSEACGANIREEWYFRANAKLYARAVNSLTCSETIEWPHNEQSDPRLTIKLGYASIMSRGNGRE